MTLQDLVDAFTAAVEAGDGKALARLFTEDGVYDDTFYGEFKGHEAIAEMLENRFWRDATDFRWDMRDVTQRGDGGYSRWIFSYTSRLRGAEGNRILFEGMSYFTLSNGRIQRYDEVFDIGIALSQTGFAADRIARIVGRAAERMRQRHEGTRHLPN